MKRTKFIGVAIASYLVTFLLVALAIYLLSSLSYKATCQHPGTWFFTLIIGTVLAYATTTDLGLAD